MEIKNQDQLDEFFETYEGIARRAADIATAMLALKGIDTHLDEDDVQIEGQSFYAEYEEYLGCGDYESHTIHIPDEYFFNADFLTDAKEQVRKEKEVKKKQLRERQEAMERNSRARERAQYEKLKKQFEAA